MLLRHSFLFLTAVAVYSCVDSNQEAASPPASRQASLPDKNLHNIDDFFAAFLERFSSDSSFQFERIRFPLAVTQYQLEYDRDTVIYIGRSEFKTVDFRKNRSEGRYDQWTQEIVPDKSGRKATIEIRGIDNGIMVDYRFEKIEGRWLLVGIEDQST